VTRVALALLHLVLYLALAPLLPGVVNRVKSRFAGRRGPPLLQLYADLGRLARKSAVYSTTSSWVFRAGPVVGFAAVAMAGALVAFGGAPAALAIPGDLVLFAYLLGLARFATVLAALDTGSSFEGMGAAREVTFAALAEPALFLVLATVARATGSLSLTGMLGPALPAALAQAAPPLALAALALFVVALAECSRIPVDDPSTHLELTMIHEVMVLDHSGPDLALILYGAALKLTLLGALFGRLALGCLPAGAGAPLGGAWATSGLLGGLLLGGRLGLRGDDVQDHGVLLDVQLGAGRQGDVLGQHRGAGVQALDGDGDRLRHVGRLGLDRQRVQHVLQQVGARGEVALGVDRDLDGDLLAAGDDDQVDVAQEALDRVALHGLRQDQLLLAVHRHGEQRVRGLQRHHQVVARDGQVDRRVAVAVDDGGDLVLAADAAGGALAELGARLGGDLDLGHDAQLLVNG
jgi:formate hydrogenlyase subunit 4